MADDSFGWVRRMDIVAGISALNGAITIAKALREADKSYDAATYKLKIAELTDAIVDGKISLSEAKDSLAENEAEIARLKKAFEEKAALVRGPGDYKYRTDAGGAPDGYPVCPRCDQIDGRIIQLVQDGSPTKAKCPSCLNSFSPVSALGAERHRQEENRRQHNEAIARSNARLGRSLA